MAKLVRGRGVSKDWGVFLTHEELDRILGWEIPQHSEGGYLDEDDHELLRTLEELEERLRNEGS